MIVSTVSGRIRLRSNRLKSRKIATKAMQQAEELAGVTDVRINPAAGSLVVSYDTRAVDTVELEDQLEVLCMPPKLTQRDTRKIIGRYANKATKVGMLTTLGTSLAYAYMGNKKAHIRFGQAFVVFAGLHLLRYQSTLLR